MAQAQISVTCQFCEEDIGKQLHKSSDNTVSVNRLIDGTKSIPCNYWVMGLITVECDGLMSSSD